MRAERGEDDPTEAFWRATQDLEVPLPEFRQAVRDMDQYHVNICQPRFFQGIAKLWIRYLGNHHPHDQNDNDPLCLLTELEQPFSASLLLTMEKTRCIFLESKARRRPLGGTFFTLLHTMIYWKLPYFLLYLAGRIYPHELYMRDSEGKLPLDKAVDWAGNNSMLMYWDALEDAFRSYCTSAVPAYLCITKDTASELNVKQNTPIAVLSHLITTSATASRKRKRSTKDDQETCDSSTQFVPALESFLHKMASKGQAWHCYLYYPRALCSDGNRKRDFELTKRLLEDLECLIKLAPSALARAKTITIHHQLEEEEFMMLPACMIPAAYHDYPPRHGIFDYDDDAPDLLSLNLIYFTLRQDPLVLFASFSRDFST